jgi:hypothetical protein
MSGAFSVLGTAGYARGFKKLVKTHPELIEIAEEAISILEIDPYNRSRTGDVKKLTNVPPEEGNFRLRLGRWRFRHSIYGAQVVLHDCALRREDTY